MRATAIVCGIAALLLAWAGPLSHLASHAFFAHMTIHMLVVAVAAPLIALGIAGGPLDPVPRLPRFFAPIPASVGELIIVWAWHAPVPHHVARQEVWGLVGEQGSFLLAGLWVWLAAFGGTETLVGHDTLASPDANGRVAPELFPVTRLQRRAAGIVGLLLTSMHMTFLGALLAMSPRPLYAHHHGIGLLSPLADQHLGGCIMLVFGGVAYLTGGLALTGGLLKTRSKTQVSDL